MSDHQHTVLGLLILILVLRLLGSGRLQAAWAALFGVVHAQGSAGEAPGGTEVGGLPQGFVGPPAPGEAYTGPGTEGILGYYGSQKQG